MRTSLTTLCALALSGAATPAADAQGAGASADLLVCRVSERGAEPCLSRIPVTPSPVRMDNGVDGKGFVLFDRGSRIIYRADPGERTVPVIDPAHHKPEAPMPLDLSEQRELLDVRHQLPVAPGRFGIPEGYRRISVPPRARQDVLARGVSR